MKYFTEPSGLFVLQIPAEWQYRNVILGIEEVSPFGFELYKNKVGAFQISCYPYDKSLAPENVIQNYNTVNLKFIHTRMDGGGFNMHLWYAIVEDYAFMAKYIYSTKSAENAEVGIELIKVEKVLSTLELLSEDKREAAISYDKYIKFNASLTASFDLKNKAYESNSPIELLVIIANQIDAYLRIAIVIKRQILENTDKMDSAFLYQGENDPPLMERTIYKKAKELNIISEETYSELGTLYTERNKIIHRYIISDLKTIDIYIIVKRFDDVCEIVRQNLKIIEDMSFSSNVGIHSGERNPQEMPEEKDINNLYSLVNDKHMLNDLFREIKESK